MNISQDKQGGQLDKNFLLIYPPFAPLLTILSYKKEKIKEKSAGKRMLYFPLLAAKLDSGFNPYRRLNLFFFGRCHVDVACRLGHP
jgi:hypothetical protein